MTRPVKALAGGRGVQGGSGMRIRADLKCYYCGHVSGQIEGDTTQPIRYARFSPSAPPGRGTGGRPGRPFRCQRCGGPVYLDEIEVVRPRRTPSTSAGEGPRA